MSMLTKNTSLKGGEKNTSAPQQSSPAPTTQPTAKPKPIPSPTAKSSIPTTAVIGPKIKVRGELVGEEDILVQGEVEGLIDLKDHTLTVGNNGVVKANVLANVITVEGNMEGDLYGQHKIAILASSAVKGNLIAERVILEDGASFQGSIDMDVAAHQEEIADFASSSTPKKSATTEQKSTTSKQAIGQHNPQVK